jgi:hypothetical protein
MCRRELSGEEPTLPGAPAFTDATPNRSVLARSCVKREHVTPGDRDWGVDEVVLDMDR